MLLFNILSNYCTVAFFKFFVLFTRLSDNLVLDESHKVEVGVVCERIQRELGEVVANSVIGKCLRTAFGSKVKNLQNSKRVRCYYGVRFVADAVHGTGIVNASQSFHVLPTRDQDNLTEEENKKLQPESDILQSKNISEKLRYKKVINLYRNERMERQNLTECLVKEKEMSKYSKSLQLPSSMYLEEDELIENPLSKTYSGAFGTCSLYKYRGMDVAVKAYHDLDGFSDNSLKKIVLREANVLLNLHSHKGIPKLLGVVLNKKPYQMVTSFHGINGESTTVRKILQKKCQGMAAALPNSKQDWFKVFGSIADVLLHIHKAGYVHGDLKTDNVLIEAGMCAVIIDFGKSVLANKAKLNKIPLSEQSDYQAKYPWVAPEVVNGTTPLSRESDIYAYGCLIRRIMKACELKSKRLDEITANAMNDNPGARYCLTRIQNILLGYF